MRVLGFYFFLFLFSTVYAQKLKYADIYTAIQSGKVQEGEQMLVTYLVDPKNQSEANAFLQFGYIMADKQAKRNPLTEKDAVISAGDSVAIFLQKAILLITDKELKKNSDYYQSFYRRDLRTGEFGIKLSDVQLELETKMNDAQTRTENTKLLHQKLEEIQQLDAEMMAYYNEIVGQYASYSDLVLKGESQEIKTLNNILTDFDKLKEVIGQVAALGGELGINDRYKELRVKRMIGAFGKRESILDMNASVMEIWDMERFVNEAKKDITQDVVQFKSEITAVDKQVTEARNKLMDGINSSFPTQVPETVMSLARRYQKDAVPVRMIEALIKECEIWKMTHPTFNATLNDESQAAFNLKNAETVLVKLNELKEIISGLDERVIPESRYYVNYNYDRYRGEQNLINTIKEKQNWTNEQLVIWEENRFKWDIAVNWLITGKDTLSLKPQSEMIGLNPTTLSNISISDSLYFILGVRPMFNSGFTYLLDQDKKIVWSYEYNVLLDSISGLPELVVIDKRDNQIIFYQFSQTETSSGKIALIKATQNTKDAWVQEFESHMKPSNFIYNITDGSIKLLWQDTETKDVLNQVEFFANGKRK